jgi:outer membrane protein
MMLRSLILLFPLVFNVAHAEQASRFEQNLNDAIDFGTKHSGSVGAARESEGAAHFQAKAAGANLLPNLSIQGDYHYNSNVPQLTLGPGQQLNFGTHDNYSVGPVLNYTVFDAGRDRGNRDSAEVLADAQGRNRQAKEAQLELSIRQAYFQVQYNLRQLELTLDSLKLAQAQSRDVNLRFRSGASSRLDDVQAKQDVINYRLRFRQAQNELASSFRNLLALEGNTLTIDTSRPVSARLADKLPPEVEKPTLVLGLEPLEESIRTLNSDKKTFSGESHPEVQALEKQAQSAKRQADAEGAARYPKLDFYAKALYEYPNYVLPENAWQDTVGATLTFQLFEGGASRNRSAQHLKEASSAEFQKQQRLIDLTRDETKANDSIQSLRAQKQMNDESVVQAKEVQHLTYQSYKSGKSRYLDVQDADVKLLQAQVSAAQIDAQILSQLAILNYLSAQ